jgi:hypothetical protein
VEPDAALCVEAADVRDRWRPDETDDEEQSFADFDALRTSYVYVPGSRRYSDTAAYLLTTEAWSTQAGVVLPARREVARSGGCAGVVADNLASALGELEQVLAAGDGPGPLLDVAAPRSRRRTAVAGSIPGPDDDTRTEIPPS